MIAAAPSPVVVLIVDDDRPIAKYVAAVVAEAGYSPVVATRGQEALELARSQWPALLITDLMLPFMGGGALIATMRDIAAAEDRPVPAVVLITAAGTRSARNAEADAVLHKPFALADLEALLQRLLEPSDGQDTPRHAPSDHQG